MDRAALTDFHTALLEWCRTDSAAALVRAFRLPLSGVEHDVAAAYAAVAARVGPLLDAIAKERVPYGGARRDSLLRFSERVRSLQTFAAGGADDAAVLGRARELFPDAPVSRATAAGQSGDFALARSSDAGPRAPVRARQQHFSASALNAYVECSRKWFYRYVCAAVEDPPSSASTYGTAFHAALEDFHGEFPQPRQENERAMRETIVGYVNWAFERHRAEFDSAVEVELQKRRAQRTAAKYIDWLVAEAKRAPFTVVGREMPVSLELDGFAFVGFIDRVDRDDRGGGVAIVDYKTGTIATTAAEYREKVQKFKEFQLPFYYWARTAAGDRVNKLSLIPLKDALADVRPVSLEVVAMAANGDRRDAASGTISIADLERARTRMVEICTELTNGALDAFAVTRDAAACTYCAYSEACARRPIGQRERFAR